MVTRGRPKSPNPKVQQTIRIDADVLAAFKATGKGWQTRINQALRDELKEPTELSRFIVQYNLYLMKNGESASGSKAKREAWYKGLMKALKDTYDT